MAWTRLLGASSRAALRSSSLDPLRPRFRPFSRFHSKDYEQATDYKDQRLERKYSEDYEYKQSRSWATYAIPAAILAISGTAMYVKYNDEKRAIPKGSEQSMLSDRSNSARPVIGGPFKLVDTENNLVTESDLRGNWILLYFGYTSSPDIGPDEVQKMANAVDIVETKIGVKVKPVFITIDPQRDTAAQLRAYLREFDSRIVGLTGPIAAVRQVAQEYRVFFKKVEDEGHDYLVECSHTMYLLDPNMEIAKFFGVEYCASQLADDVIKEIRRRQNDSSSGQKYTRKEANASK